MFHIDLDQIFRLVYLCMEMIDLTFFFRSLKGQSYGNKFFELNHQTWFTQQAF